MPSIWSGPNFVMWEWVKEPDGALSSFVLYPCTIPSNI